MHMVSGPWSQPLKNAPAGNQCTAVDFDPVPLNKGVQLGVCFYGVGGYLLHVFSKSQLLKLGFLPS